MSDDQDRLGNVPRILNHNKTRWEWISLHFPSYSNTRLSRSATIRESHSCFQYSSFLFCQEQTISQYFGGNRYPFTKTQAHVAAYRRIISPNSRRVSQGNLTTWEPANITWWSEEQAWFFGVFKVQICIIWVIYSTIGPVAHLIDHSWKNWKRDRDSRTSRKPLSSVLIPSKSELGWSWSFHSS